MYGMLYSTKAKNSKYIKIHKKTAELASQFNIWSGSFAVILSGFCLSLFRIHNISLKIVFREFKYKHSGFSGSALYRNISSMLFQDVLYKRQSQSRSAHGAGTDLSTL